MKIALGFFVVSVTAAALAIILLVMAGIRQYSATRLDWFFEPIQAADIPLYWVLVAPSSVAIVTYLAALAVEGVSSRKT